MKTYDEARSGATLRARELRRAGTEAERLLWRALRESLPQFKWRRRMPVGPYFADFACFAEKLIVELDGGQHTLAGEQDARRTAFLKAHGYRVIRFWNNDVLSNTDGVLEQISLSLGRGKQQRMLRKGGTEQALTPLTPSPNPLPAGEGFLEF